MDLRGVHCDERQNSATPETAYYAVGDSAEQAIQGSSYELAPVVEVKTLFSLYISKAEQN